MRGISSSNLKFDRARVGHLRHCLQLQRVVDPRWCTCSLKTLHLLNFDETQWCIDLSRKRAELPSSRTRVGILFFLSVITQSMLLKTWNIGMSCLRSLMPLNSSTHPSNMRSYALVIFFDLPNLIHAFKENKYVCSLQMFQNWKLQINWFEKLIREYMGVNC